MPSLQDATFEYGSITSLVKMSEKEDPIAAMVERKYKELLSILGEIIDRWICLRDDIRHRDLMLRQYEKDKKDNENYQFYREEVWWKLIELKSGSAMNCMWCHKTCHEECREVSCDDLFSVKKCRVMDERGYCAVCGCPWQHHMLQPRKWSRERKKVVCTREDMLKRYNEATRAVQDVTTRLGKLRQELQDQRQRMYEQLCRILTFVEEIDKVGGKLPSIKMDPPLERLSSVVDQAKREGDVWKVVDSVLGRVD